MAKMTESPWFIIQMVIDVCYVCDIIVGFMTSYIDPFNGDEYFSLKKIAKHYVVEGVFLIDFLSIFWFSQICTALGIYNQTLFVVFKALKLLKVLRLMSVSKLIRGAHATVEVKALYQVAYFTLILIIYTHVVACIMWYMMKTNKIWVPAVDFGAL